MGVLLPNYPEENIVKGENVPNFTSTGTSEGTSNVLQILQDLQLKQYLCHGLKIRIFYFFYISKTLQMNRISFMASLLNAVL